MLNRGGAETQRINQLTEAQLLTYLKFYNIPLGLLINFNVPVLRQGIKRLVNNFDESSAPPRLGGE